MIGLVRPLTDTVTSLTYEEGEIVKRLLEAKNIKVIDIAKYEVTRENIENSIERNGIKQLIFLGHGSAFSFIGSEMDNIIKAHSPGLQLVWTP